MHCYFFEMHYFFQQIFIGSLNLENFQQTQKQKKWKRTTHKTLPPGFLWNNQEGFVLLVDMRFLLDFFTGKISKVSLCIFRSMNFPHLKVAGSYMSWRVIGYSFRKDNCQHCLWKTRIWTHNSSIQKLLILLTVLNIYNSLHEQQSL